MKSSLLEFDKPSKVQWIEHTLSKLDETSRKSLDWTLGDGNFSAFYHKEDVRQDYDVPLKKGNKWQLGAFIRVQSLSEDKHTIGTLLNEGVDLLILNIEELDIRLLSDLIADIMLQHVGLQLEYNPGDMAAIIEILYAHAEKSEANLEGLDISIIHNIKDAKVDIVHLWELPGSFRTFRVNGTPYFSGKDKVIEEICGIMTELIALKTSIGQQGDMRSGLGRRIIIDVVMDHHFFVNIGKVRALRKLWAEIIERPSDQNGYPCFSATLPTDDPMDGHSGLISRPIQSLSAVIAGMDRLVFQNRKSGSQSENAGRIDRNISRILQRESYMDIVSDPSSGSYFIEHLTSWIYEQVLERLKTQKLV